MKQFLRHGGNIEGGRPSPEGRELKLDDGIAAGALRRRPSPEGRELKPRELRSTLPLCVAPHPRGAN